MEHLSRDQAFDLLKKYNSDPFHIQHALTVEAVMKWYANELGYGITVDVAPEHEMEKVLFAADKLPVLSGLLHLYAHPKAQRIWSLNPLRKIQEQRICCRLFSEVIERGADQLGWELDKLLTMTLDAMKATEDEINAEM